MAINWTPKLVAVGVGVVDEVFSAMDESAGRVASFKTWDDFYRIGVTILALAGETTAKGTLGTLSRDVSGPIITLLTKSVAKPIRASLKTGVTGVSRGAFSRPAAAGGGIKAYQPIEPTPKLY